MGDFNQPPGSPGENKPSRTWLWPAVWIFVITFLIAVGISLYREAHGAYDTWTWPIAVAITGVIGVWIASAIARKDKGGL